MASETPPFWWQKPDWRAFALAPAAFVYGQMARRRLSRTPRDNVDLPILCVSDLAVGVSGKTQVAMAFARAATALGHRPGILCAAPSGTRLTSHMVDAAHDSARHVGDQAIEMASVAPVAVSSDRAAAARMLAAEGCDLCIVADGYSILPLRAHYLLLVVESLRGLGNGRVIPAGPLRARLTDQICLADGILRIGHGNNAGSVVRAAARAGRPVYEADVVPRPSSAIAGRQLLAFTATKDPDGFFDAVKRAGGIAKSRREFAQARIYSAEDIRELLNDAEAGQLELVTTRRDAIRLGNGEPLPDGFLAKLKILDMAIEFEVDVTAKTIIGQTIATWRNHSRALNGGS